MSPNVPKYPVALLPQFPARRQCRGKRQDVQGSEILASVFWARAGWGMGAARGPCEGTLRVGGWQRGWSGPVGGGQSGGTTPRRGPME